MDALGPNHLLTKRAADLRKIKHSFLADVTLYSTDQGGKNLPAYPGWGCPCIASTDKQIAGWDAWPVLEKPILPGDKRKNVPFVFLSEEGAEAIGKLESFYLWEGKVIGEASIVKEPSD